MVEELMIAAGETAALLAYSEGVIVPYRVQDKPLDVLEFRTYDSTRSKSDMAKNWGLISRLRPSRFAIAPGPHFSLGLSNYAQVTSPLRRYADLLAHYQLKAVLRGEEPPFLGWQFLSIFRHLEAKKGVSLELNDYSIHLEILFMNVFGDSFLEMNKYHFL
jgi:exoribonuclease-2